MFGCNVYAIHCLVGVWGLFESRWELCKCDCVNAFAWICNVNVMFRLLIETQLYMFGLPFNYEMDFGFN